MELVLLDLLILDEGEVFRLVDLIMTAFLALLDHLALQAVV